MFFCKVSIKISENENWKQTNWNQKTCVSQYNENMDGWNASIFLHLYNITICLNLWASSVENCIVATAGGKFSCLFKETKGLAHKRTATAAHGAENKGGATFCWARTRSSLCAFGADIYVNAGCVRCDDRCKRACCCALNKLPANALTRVAGGGRAKGRVAHLFPSPNPAQLFFADFAPVR